MRYVFGFLCVCALGVMPLVGCSETTGVMLCEGVTCEDDGNECTGSGVCDPADGECDYAPVVDGTECGDESNECAVGQCASGACELTPVTNGTACGDNAGTCEVGSCQVACTEQGIRDAIAAGGGPYTFDCVGPQTVVTEAPIVIDNDVILDGEGNLTVDGGWEDGSPEETWHTLFRVAKGVEAEMLAMSIVGAGCSFECEDTVGISNSGTLTLTNSSVFGSCCEGIRNNAMLTLADATVSENGATGIVNQEGTLTLTNSTVSTNRGAGILNFSGAVTMTNTAVSRNGAGIWSGSGTVTLVASTVSENAGPGIENDEGTLTVTDSTVSGHGDRGIDNFGTLTLTNSTVSDNACVGCVGGGIRNEGMLTMTNSTVSGNTANWAGGIHNDNFATALLSNCTVSDNVASEGNGGGIYNDEGTLTVMSSTLSGNTTVMSSGAAIFNRAGTAALANTVVDGDCLLGVVLVSLGHNIESPLDTCGFDQATDQVNISEDDLNLGPLAENGGPTMTHKPGDGEFGDESDAIDQIPEDACEVTTDQRGVTRPQGPACDVGAVEVEVAP